MLTTGVYTTLAALSFALAGGSSAFAFRAPSHDASQPREAQPALGTAASHAHRELDTSLPERHHHTAADCTCRGACAATAPRAAPSDAQTLAFLDRVEQSAAPARAAAPPPRGLKAYLFPLPNAPPFRA